MNLAYGISGGLILVAYFLGSIPTGYWAGRLLKGIDIREQGSGSTGATNVLRTLGKPAGITVLAIDILKGALAVALVPFVINQWANDIIPQSWQAWLVLFAGVAAIFGHGRSIFLNFTGGKAVATSLGVLLVMSPLVGLSTFGSFLLLFALSRTVSIGSLTGAIAVMLLMPIFQQPLPYCLFGLMSGLYVIIRHKANIQRILAGTEPKVGQKLTDEVSMDAQ